MINSNAVRISSHARFALGEAGVTGGVITKSNEQTDNVSLCSLCPPCNMGLPRYYK
jgi:hypothetical protein